MFPEVKNLEIPKDDTNIWKLVLCMKKSVENDPVLLDRQINRPFIKAQYWTCTILHALSQ